MSDAPQSVVGWPMCCPSCGLVMVPARLLKGYPKAGDEAERLTCALHGPLGPYRHLVSRARFGWDDYGDGSLGTADLAPDGEAA